VEQNYRFFANRLCQNKKALIFFTVVSYDFNSYMESKCCSKMGCNLVAQGEYIGALVGGIMLEIRLGYSKLGQARLR